MKVLKKDFIKAERRSYSQLDNVWENNTSSLEYSSYTEQGAFCSACGYEMGKKWGS